MRVLSFAPACALILHAVTAQAQCPDGTPPPCSAARRAATPAHPIPSPEARTRRFLLLPFRNVTRGAEQEWLVTGAPLMLGDALAQFRDLVVIPDEVITAARRRLSLPPDAAPDATQLKRLAEETDGWTAITGSVLTTGGRMHFSVQALDIPTSRVLVRADADVAGDAEVRDALNRLGARLLEPTGMSATAADFGAPPTMSVDAYRAYVRGIDFLHRSAYHRAQDAFSEAVRLDSTFSLAWARLAYSAAAANPAMIMDPASPLMRATEQAVRHAGRLPPRQAQLVRSLQAFVRGQPSRALRIADSLASTDPDDLDAREWLASVTWIDPVLDTTATPLRHEGSWNRAMMLAREVLERDPGRRNVYATLVMGYAAGGGVEGCHSGLRREPGSLFAMVATLSQPGDCMVMVLRDSIEEVSATTWNRMPADDRARQRRRNADAAMEWVERWLAAGPEDGEAHWWASRVAELRGDLPRAMKEAVAAESLGVERKSLIELGPERRMILNVRLGRYAAAGALADSLLAGGSLAKPPLMVVFNRTRRFGAAALLLSKRWSAAAALAEAMGTPAGGRPPCANLLGELVAGSVSAVPNDALVAVMDTVALHFREVAAMRTLVPCIGNLAANLLPDDPATALRTRAGVALLSAADSLIRTDSALAYRAARAAWAADSTKRGAIAGREWFARRSRAAAFGGAFAPAGALVDGDSALFSFRLTGDRTFQWDAPEYPVDWTFRVALSGARGADTTTFALRLSHAWRAREATSSGGVPEMVAAITAREASTDPARPGATPMTTGISATADGFRVVVRGAFVTELRRLRPTTALFTSDPCIGVTDGLCASPRITVEYR
jgi:TolB-like protein